MKKISKAMHVTWGGAIITALVGFGVASVLSNTKAPRGGKFNVANPDDPYSVVISDATLPITSNFLTHLNDGGVIEVVLDACPFEDYGWNPEGDPLGNLKCGETYVVRYNPIKMEWYGRGLEEFRSGRDGERFIGTRNMKGTAPQRGEIFVWGVRFVAKEDGTLQTRLTAKSDPVTVGHFNLK